jgi:hypothetical protein
MAKCIQEINEKSFARIPEVKGCAVIMDDQLGVRGEIELKLLTSDA